MIFLIIAEDACDGRRVESRNRLEQVLAAVRGAGHRTVLLRGLPAGAAAHPIEGADEILDLDLGRFEGRTAVEGVAREVAAQAIVASGLVAAMAVGQIELDVPIWLDLEADVQHEIARHPLPMSGDVRVGSWHRWVWAIDRADTLSCATSAIFEFARGSLASRGRAKLVAGAGVEFWSPSAEAVPAGLSDWISSPTRAPREARVLGRAEISDVTALQRSQAELEQVSRFCRSVQHLGSRVRNSLAGLARRLNSGAAHLVLVPLLASRAGALWLWARIPGRPDGESFLRGPSPKQREQVRVRLGRPPRVLVVMPYRLFPPRHGGAVRLWNLLTHVCKEVDVYLLLFDQHGISERQTQTLERFCKRVFVHHWQPNVNPSAWSLKPAGSNLFDSDSARRRIRELVESEAIDVVQLENSELGGLRTAAGPAKVVIAALELAFRSIARRRRLRGGFGEDVARHFGGSVLDELRMFLFELKNARRADEVHVMSEVDGFELARYVRGGSRALRLVPNGVDFEKFSEESRDRSRSGILLAGNFAHAQNHEGATWFLNEVWPLVLASRSESTLSIVGAEIPEEIRARHGNENVVVVGEVEEIVSVYQRHELLVVPVRTGSGTRLKIAEAFAAGIVVVSTEMGAEGLAVADGRELRIAESANEFAASIVGLLDDRSEWRRLQEAARSRARSWDWKISAEAMVQSVYALTGGDPSAERSTAPIRVDEAPERAVDVSVVIPTQRGGELLEQVVEAIRTQRCGFEVEVLCVDSGSEPAQLERLRRNGVRIAEIEPQSFNHGLTRDLGARLSRGRYLVFLNQDALPASENWLESLVGPLLGSAPPAAVQGAIEEFPRSMSGVAGRFFWDSCGPRFYFTSESENWIRRFSGIGFSTVNAAIRRDVWEKNPFGWAPILEDKRWQAEATRRGWAIVESRAAVVFHSHDYNLGSLWRRCRAEGTGWRWLGERYGFGSAVRDSTQCLLWRELGRHLGTPAARRPAALLFPALRPLALWWGNRAAPVSPRR